MSERIMAECRRRIGTLKLPVTAEAGEIRDAAGEVVCRFHCTIGKSEYEWARAAEVAEMLNALAQARAAGRAEGEAALGAKVAAWLRSDPEASVDELAVANALAALAAQPEERDDD